MKTRFVRDLKAVQADFQKSVLIFDRKLLRQHGAWIRRFPFRYAVTSGEALKDLRAFPKHAENLLSQWPKHKVSEIRVIAFGGGSVGDFAGFFASVAKRGVSVVQVPSTWLAAVDSAHGGKTALNVNGTKNQIGTFHQAEKVWLVKEVLIGLPAARLAESFGEIIKIALLDQKVWKKLAGKDLNQELVWRLLPELIKAKMKIVQRDPQEKNGVRQLLNLGHSMGHAFEAALQIPHGQAVALGTRFALMWSEKNRLLNPRIWDQLAVFERAGLFPDRQTYLKALEQIKNPKNLLEQDKKLQGRGKIRFIFLRRAGYPVIRTVSIEEIQRESLRQRRELVSLSRGH